MPPGYISLFPVTDLQMSWAIPGLGKRFYATKRILSTSLQLILAYFCNYVHKIHLLSIIQWPWAPQPVHTPKNRIGNSWSWYLMIGFRSPDTPAVNTPYSQRIQNPLYSFPFKMLGVATSTTSGWTLSFLMTDFVFFQPPKKIWIFKKFNKY